MPVCSHRPLTASAGTSDSPKNITSKSVTLKLLNCYSSTATPCNHYCAGCTAFDVSHSASVLVALVCLLMWRHIGSAVALTAYIAVGIKQHVDGLTEHLQLTQAALVAVTGAFAASDANASFIVCLSFIAVLVHITQAMLIMELMRLGDCRRCLSDASHCSCGRLKDAVPEGLLSSSAICIQQTWKRSHASS